MVIPLPDLEGAIETAHVGADEIPEQLCGIVIDGKASFLGATFDPDGQVLLSRRFEEKQAARACEFLSELGALIDLVPRQAKDGLEGGPLEVVQQWGEVLGFERVDARQMNKTPRRHHRQRASGLDHPFTRGLARRKLVPVEISGAGKRLLPQDRGGVRHQHGLAAHQSIDGQESIALDVPLEVSVARHVSARRGWRKRGSNTQLVNDVLSRAAGESR